LRHITSGSHRVFEGSGGVDRSLAAPLLAYTGINPPHAVIVDTNNPNGWSDDIGIRIYLIWMRSSAILGRLPMSYQLVFVFM
jgi:hypothetical protein